MNEVRRYFHRDGLFAGGEGEPTISGVLAFPEVGPLRCDDPVLWVHPRFEGEFPQTLNDLEIRNAPGAESEVRVRHAQKTCLLKNLGVVESRLGDVGGVSWAVVAPARCHVVGAGGAQEAVVLFSADAVVGCADVGTVYPGR